MIRTKTILLALFTAALLLSETTVEAAKKWRPKLGLQSWTCRHMSFDQVVTFAKHNKIKYLELNKITFCRFNSMRKLLMYLMIWFPDQYLSITRYIVLF